MILDRFNEFCDNVALNTGGAGTYLLGNQIDLVDARDIGHGNTNLLYLVIVVTQTATSGGSATLRLTLASDATAAIATNGTATEHISTPTFPVASLSAGKILLVTPLPLEGNPYEQFIGILQTTGTAAFTAGRIDAFLTPDPQLWKAHKDEASR
jgi:hypothetical protein